MIYKLQTSRSCEMTFQDDKLFSTEMSMETLGLYQLGAFSRATYQKI